MSQILFSFFRRRPMTLKATISEGFLAGLSDAEAIRLFARDFDSELSHLRNASPTVESGSAAPQGNIDKDGKSPSRFLYGKDFSEVNRTLVSLLALKWILADDYASFTASQSHGRLSEQSFRHLCDFFKKKVQNADDIYALFVAIMIDDIGKDPRLAAKLKTSNHHENHSEAVLDAAKAGKIHALRHVSSTARKTILSSLEIGAKLNLSQLMQGESVPACLSVLKQHQTNENGCDMRTMVTLLDVAGAGAHNDPRGCLVMTESVYQSYMAMIEIVKKLIRKEIPEERACYDSILSDRAECLHKQGFQRLSTSDQEEHALLRMLCMGRVDTKEWADIFQAAFTTLTESNKQDLVNGLSVSGLDDGVAIVPYYSPGLLAEVIRIFQGKENSIIISALSAYMRFLARVFDGSKPRSDTPGGVIERDLSFVQDVIKSDIFRNDPNILDSVGHPWKAR